MTGNDKIKDKFHSRLTETDYNNINASSSPIYDHEDFVPNNDRSGDIVPPLFRNFDFCAIS